MPSRLHVEISENFSTTEICSGDGFVADSLEQGASAVKILVGAPPVQLR